MSPSPGKNTMSRSAGPRSRRYDRERTGTGALSKEAHQRERNARAQPRLRRNLFNRRPKFGRLGINAIAPDNDDWIGPESFPAPPTKAAAESGSEISLCAPDLH